MRRVRTQVVAMMSVLLLGVAFVAPAGAHPGRGSHMWNVHIKPKLSNEGTINQPSNPVHWTKLKGVPAGFADGVDSVDSGPATDVDCSSPCVQNAEIESVDASKITGGITADDVDCSTTCVQNGEIESVEASKITGTITADDVDCTTTCVQNAEIESVDASKITGTITADDVDCSTTCVQNAEIESVASSKITGTITADDVDCSTPCVQSGEVGTGEIRGGAAGLDPAAGHIRNQTITGGTDGNLALDTITADNLAPGSVGTSELTGGAVTTEKMEANWATGTGAGAELTEATPSADLIATNVNLTDEDAQNHVVWLSGAVYARCTPCEGGSTGATVTAQLVEDDVPIGPAFTVALDGFVPAATLPLTFPRSATASDDPGTDHTYEIRVTASGSTGFEVDITNPQLSAMDFGRA